MITSRIENLILGVSSIMLINIFSKYYWKRKLNIKEEEKIVINKISVDLDTKHIPSINKDFELNLQKALNNNGIKNVRIYRNDESITQDVDNNRLNIEYKYHLTKNGKKKMITKIFMG